MSIYHGWICLACEEVNYDKSSTKCKNCGKEKGK